MTRQMVARLAGALALLALVAGFASARADERGQGRAVSAWRDRTPAGAAPGAGEDCSTVYYPPHHSIVLYGGKGDDDVDGNALWEYDLDHERWSPIAVTGPAPPPREDHTLIYDPVGDRVIVYGGENGPTSNTLWTYEFARGAWRDLTSAESPPREDHTAVYDSRGKRMVVFGGWAGEERNFYDVRALDLDPASPHFEHWLNLTAETPHPWGRSDHVAVYDSLKNRMVIFGGWDKEQKQYLDDTWAYAFAAAPESAGAWKQVKTKHSHPPKRREAVGVYDRAHNWFVVFGGFGEEGYLNDAWAFDLSQDLWIDITPGPQPRIDHQAVFDPVSGHMIVYGGDAKIGPKFHDLWELEIAPDAPLAPMIEQAAGKAKK